MEIVIQRCNARIKKSHPYSTAAVLVSPDQAVGAQISVYHSMLKWGGSGGRERRCGSRGLVKMCTRVDQVRGKV